jgi:hypothetical protein
MKTRVNLAAVAAALITMAIVSLLVIAGLNRVDHIVHNVLYDYGLVFSYRWAMPYWINSIIIICLSWFNITMAVILAYYVFRRRERPPSLEGEPAETAETLAPEYVEQPANLVETQILDQYCESLEPQIKIYDVRHPKDVIDSQC